MALKAYSEMEYHPTSEKIVDEICTVMGRTERNFFRNMCAYYLCKVSSMMGTTAHGPCIDRKIPTNLFSFNFASSGFSKTRTRNLFEREIVGGFMQAFLTDVMPIQTERNLAFLATKHVNLDKGIDEERALAIVQSHFKNTGEDYVPAFDGGSSPAAKQHRDHILYRNICALNLEIDEVGNKFSELGPILTDFLELYDEGYIKNKLVKNSSENKRGLYIDGSTPANMLCFGTPVFLFDDGPKQQLLSEYLITGGARRCLFGYSERNTEQVKRLTGKEQRLARQAQKASSYLPVVFAQLANLADIGNVHQSIYFPDGPTDIMGDYKTYNEERAEKISINNPEKLAEMEHRHFKATKLAATYAFIDGVPEVTEEHVYAAIKLVEDSGEAFHRLMTKASPYEKMARTIVENGHEYTSVTLAEELPFYKALRSQRSKDEMLRDAITWGYQNQIIIRRRMIDGIEFISGEELEKTNIDKLILSTSDHEAYNYKNIEVPFSKLHGLASRDDRHWATHHFTHNHRCEDHAREDRGFNCIVLDVDNGTPMAIAQDLLSEYKCFFYTTKRHTPEYNRYRIVMPINFRLHMDSANYTEFMRNIYEWLPFDVDDTSTRSKKWLSNKGTHVYNNGDKLLDVMPFIPRTQKNDERKKALKSLADLDSLDRWFIEKTMDGNRNKMLCRYAFMLVDAGGTYEQVRERVLNLNSRMLDSLPETELDRTVMVSVNKRIAGSVQP